MLLSFSKLDTKFVRIELDGKCDVASFDISDDEIKLQLRHFSYGFFATIFQTIADWFENDYVKKISLRPYLPITMPRNRRPILRVLISDALKGNKEVNNLCCPTRYSYYLRVISQNYRLCRKRRRN